MQGPLGAFKAEAEHARLECAAFRNAAERVVPSNEARVDRAVRTLLFKASIRMMNLSPCLPYMQDDPSHRISRIDVSGCIWRATDDDARERIESSAAQKLISMVAHSPLFRGEEEGLLVIRE